MKVLLNIPEDVKHLIEYLPEDEMSNILVGVIREGILSRIEIKKEVEPQASVDIQALVSLLSSQGLVPTNTTQTDVSVGQVQEATIVKEKEEVQQVILEVESVEDDGAFDDLDDFADLMK